MSENVVPNLLSYLTKNSYLMYTGFILVGILGTIIISKINFEQKEIILNEVSENKTMIVDISGAVNAPGVYQVEDSTRVADVIKMAQGYKDNANTIWISKYANLSEKLADESKIYVPFEWEKVEDISEDVLVLQNTTPTANASSPVVHSTEEERSEETSSSADQNVDTTTKQDQLLIDVNTSSQEDLESLAGIGPKYAEKIILNRPYKDKAELISKTKLPTALVDKISNQITY